MHRRALLSVAVPLLAGCISGPSRGSSVRSPFEVGEPHTTDDGARVALEEVVVTDSISTDRGDRSASHDRLYLLTRVSASNTGDRPVSLPAPAEFRVVLHTEQFEPDTAIATLTDPVSGAQYDAVEDARPGVKDDGWLVFGVPRRPGSVVLSWLSPSSERTVRWTYDATVPMHAYPRMELDTLSATERSDGDIEIEVVLSNNGGEPGVLDILLWTVGVMTDEHGRSVSVPPGESVTRTHTITDVPEGELVVGIHPFDKTVTVDVG